MARAKQTARKSTGGKNFGIKSSGAAAKKVAAKTVSRSTAGKTIPNQKKKKSGVKKPRKFRVLHTIRELQRGTNLLVPKLSFSRLVRQITSIVASDVRWKANAMAALQEASEHFMIQLFEDSQECAIHCKRVTIMDRDVRLVLRMRSSRHDYH